MYLKPHQFNCECAKSLQSCLTLCNPLDYSPPDSSVHEDSPGKNAGVGCRALPPGDLPDPGILHLLHRQVCSSLPAPPWKSRKQCVSHPVMSDSATPWTVACQAPLSMGFPRQEYWSGLPLPSPGVLPDPGIKPGPPVLQADSLQPESPGKAQEHTANQTF